MMFTSSLRKIWPFALLSASFLISSFAHSALIGRSLDGDLTTFEAYYDTELGITWLADANYAQTSGYDADGAMTWAEANAWADGLTLGGYTDWRLPNTVDTDSAGCDSSNSGTDCGYNVDTATGEMASLFYDTLGNLAYRDAAGNAYQAGWGLQNIGPFTNLRAGDYWSVTEDASDTNYAWVVNFRYGYQVPLHKTGFLLNAWAVHSGDIGASAVPVPAAMWLFGSGLLALLGVRRRISNA